MPYPTQDDKQPKTSLEVEPKGASESPAEEYEGRKQETYEKSQRGRANISLESLEKRADRNYDAETPKLINEINFTESAEAQKEHLQALAIVSAQMIAQILARNPDIGKKFDISDFENIPLLTEYFNSIYPKAAENAAMHKLQEMRDQMTADVSIIMKEKWPELVDAAQKTSIGIKDLLVADFKKEHPERGKDGLISQSVEFAKNHQIMTAGIALAGAYGIYRLWNWMFPGKEKKKDEKAAEEGKEGDKKESEKKGGFLKWIVGGGIAIGGIFGLGRFLGADGVKKWIKDKLGWNVSDNRVSQALTHLSHGKFKQAWEVLWEGVDENSDFHEKMAEIIGKDQKTEVSAKTLFEIKDEKFEDFISWEAQAADMASTHASQIPYLGKVSQYFFDSQKENEEQIAVRGFLQKHEKTIRTLLAVRKTTTLEEVFQKLYEHLTGQKPAVVAGVVAAGAAVGAAETKSPEQQKRDAAAEKLPEAKRARAIENENVLKEKITTEEIAKMQQDIDDREMSLRDLLAKPLKPSERQKVEEKLAVFLDQKNTMGKLVDTHSESAATYLSALESDVREEVVIERFTALVEAKEAIEELYDEIFKREGWTELQALAATHAVRFLAVAYRRWLKADNINVDHANYLFDKFRKKLNPKNLIAKLRRKPIGPAASLADIRARTDKMFTDIDDSIKTWNAEATGMTKERMQRKHFEALDRFEAEAKDQHKALNKLWEDKTKELKVAIKANDTPHVKALQAEMNEIAGHKVKIEFGEMKNFGSWFQRWQEAFKGDPQKFVKVEGKDLSVYEQGINRLRMYFRKSLRTSEELQAVSEAGNRFSKVLLRRGKLVFLVGGLILGGETLADDKTGRPKAYAQAGLSMLPVTGTYLDFYSAIAGKEQITGRKLDVTDRAIAGLFGAVGLACDALSVFGIGLAGRAALTAIKGGRGMSAAVRAARIASKLDKAKDAAEAGKALKTIEALQKARKWGFRVSLGTALGVPAYMAFTESAELPVSEDFRKVVIGDDGIEVAPESPPA